MTPDQERWAEALAIERWKGPHAAAYTAERLAALKAAGDHREAAHSVARANTDAVNDLDRGLDQLVRRSSFG